MIEEYKLNYEVALARKTKLRCHPAEAIKFAYENGWFHYNVLAETMDAIQLHFEVSPEFWDNKRSASKAERQARTAIVIWLKSQGFPEIAVARILNISVPSVKWSSKQPSPNYIPVNSMRIFDNE